MGEQPDAARAELERRHEQVRAALGAPYGADWDELIARLHLAGRDLIEMTMAHNDHVAATRLRPTSSDRRRAYSAALGGEQCVLDERTGAYVTPSPGEVQRIAVSLDRNLPSPSVTRTQVAQAWHDATCTEGCPHDPSHAASAPQAHRLEQALLRLGLTLTDA